MPEEDCKGANPTESRSGDTPDLPTQTVSDGPLRGGIPRRIGQYRIKRAIASGGMGTVYEATQEQPRRVVAVKVMKLGIASRSALRRFEYESQLLARLRHPGIAQVYDAGTHRDSSGTVPYFAMEYIPNAKPITDYVREKTPGYRARLELFAQVCDAVHHGHQKGIIHRDLKPANILVDSQGQPKIIDFGVARSTDSDMAVTTLQTDVGQLIGTLQYMSPERLSAVDRTLRGDLETVVLKALEKERDRRYQSALELAQDIRRYLSREAISARPPSIVYQLRMFARRHRAGFAAIAAIFVVLVAGVVVSTSLYIKAESAREQAEARRVQAEEVTEFLNDTLASVDPAKAQGRDVTVKEMLDQAAARVDDAFPTIPLAEANLRLTMGYTYRKLGKLAEAEPHLKRALQLRRQHLGDDHRDVAEALSALGGLLDAKGDYDGAEALWQEALAINRKVAGEESTDEDVVEIRNRLGVLHYRRGDYAAAETAWREVLEIRRRRFGDEHELVAHTMNNLAVVLKAQAEYAEAESLYREALATRRRLLTDTHPAVAESLNNLATLLTEKGEYSGAEPLFREALAVNRKLHGEEHPDIARSMSNLGEVLYKKGDAAAAELLVRDAIAMQRKLVGNDQPETALMLATLGEILATTGRAGEAESVLREAVTILRKTLPEGHWLIALAQGQLGGCLSALGRYEEAEPQLVASYQAIARTRGESDQYAVEALDRVVKLYESWGKPDKADEYRTLMPVGQ
jgi:tetratricopeptide (TPR) repeat protein